MKIDKSKLLDIFSYHAPDVERAKKHSDWNALVADFVVKASEYIESPNDYAVFLRQMQEIRMLGNQTITNKAIGLNYRDIFISDNQE